MKFIEGLEGQRLLVLEELLLAVRRRKSERKLREEECAVDVLERPPSPRLPRALISLFARKLLFLSSSSSSAASAMASATTIQQVASSFSYLSDE